MPYPAAGWHPLRSSPEPPPARGGPPSDLERNELCAWPISPPVTTEDAHNALRRGIANFDRPGGRTYRAAAETVWGTPLRLPSLCDFPVAAKPMMLPGRGTGGLLRGSSDLDTECWLFLSREEETIDGPAGRGNVRGARFRRGRGRCRRLRRGRRLR